MLNCKLLQFFAVVVVFSSSGLVSLLGVGSCPDIENEEKVVTAEWIAINDQALSCF